MEAGVDMNAIVSSMNAGEQHFVTQLACFLAMIMYCKLVGPEEWVFDLMAILSHNVWTKVAQNGMKSVLNTMPLLCLGID